MWCCVCLVFCWGLEHDITLLYSQQEGGGESFFPHPAHGLVSKSNRPWKGKITQSVNPHRRWGFQHYSSIPSLLSFFCISNRWLLELHPLHFISDSSIFSFPSFRCLFSDWEKMVGERKRTLRSLRKDGGSEKVLSLPPAFLWLLNAPSLSLHLGAPSVGDVTGVSRLPTSQPWTCWPSS